MSSIPPVVVVLGPDGPRLVGPDEPVVTVDDLGLTRGDGCFDSALVVDTSRSQERDEGGPPHHVVRDLDAHLDRLDRSAAALDITGPPRPAWVALVAGVASALVLWAETPAQVIALRAALGVGAADEETALRP